MSKASQAVLNAWAAIKARYVTLAVYQAAADADYFASPDSPAMQAWRASFVTSGMSKRVSALASALAIAAGELPADHPYRTLNASERQMVYAVLDGKLKPESRKGKAKATASPVTLTQGWRHPKTGKVDSARGWKARKAAFEASQAVQATTTQPDPSEAAPAASSAVSVDVNMVATIVATVLAQLTAH